MSFIARVALVGRPNVGKSSLFNGLINRRQAIVFDRPHTTRDCLEATWFIGDHQVVLMDGQGIESPEQDPFFKPYLAKADAFFLVVDSRVGVHPQDRDLAKRLHQTGKPVLLVIHKAEGLDESELASTFSILGFADFKAASAAHRQGLSELGAWLSGQGTLEVRRVSKACEKDDQVDDEWDLSSDENTIKVALLGRPNVGKSTLMNRLCGQEVSIVSPIAHTTRDSIRVSVESHGTAYEFIDTAGIRKKRRQGDLVEQFSVSRSEQALERADVCLLLIKSTDILTEQDLRLLLMVQEAKKPSVLLYNFWDEMDDEKKVQLVEEVDRRLRHQKNRLRTLQISALTGAGTKKIFPTINELFKQSQVRWSTSKLNQWLRTLVAHHPPPQRGHGHFNILYASQISVQPPRVVVFLNRKRAIPEAYKKFLQTRLAEAMGLGSQPMELIFRSEAERQRRKLPQNKVRTRPSIKKQSKLPRHRSFSS